jgi:hypothetical protein
MNRSPFVCWALLLALGMAVTPLYGLDGDEEALRDAVKEVVRLSKKVVAKHAKEVYIALGAIAGAGGGVGAIVWGIKRWQRYKVMSDAQQYIDTIITVITEGERKVVQEIKRDNATIVPTITIYVHEKVKATIRRPVQGQVPLPENSAQTHIKMKHKRLPYTLGVTYLLPEGVMEVGSELKQTIEEKIPDTFDISTTCSWPVDVAADGYA